MDAPTHITYHKIAHTLELQWDQERYELPAELLRVYSPSAEVRGHSPDQRTLQTGKKNVGINLIEPHQSGLPSTIDNNLSFPFSG